MSEVTTHTQRQMPRYKCHKEVWALKIREIRTQHVDPPDGSVVLVPEEDGYAPFRVEADYVDKHLREPSSRSEEVEVDVKGTARGKIADDRVGGYYVVYDDGYESFSPAEAFESGYTLI